MQVESKLTGNAPNFSDIIKLLDSTWDETEK